MALKYSTDPQFHQGFFRRIFTIHTYAFQFRQCSKDLFSTHGSGSARSPLAKQRRGKGIRCGTAEAHGFESSSYPIPDAGTTKIQTRYKVNSVRTQIVVTNYILKCNSTATITIMTATEQRGSVQTPTVKNDFSRHPPIERFITIDRLLKSHATEPDQRPLICYPEKGVSDFEEYSAAALDRHTDNAVDFYIRNSLPPAVSTYNASHGPVLINK